MRTNIDLSTLPAGVLIGLGVILLIQIALDAVALVDLYRRPTTTVALFGCKWIWVAVIVLVNVIGAVLYFAIGRKSAENVGRSAAAPRRSSSEIADALYGAPEEGQQP